MRGMIVEQAEGDLVERGLDRGDLGEDVDAVAVLLHHPLDAAHLTFDASQPGAELVLGGRVSARGWRVSGIADASVPYPVWVC